MQGKSLIGTGFFANEDNYESKLRFLEVWLDNTRDHDIVIIDNAIRPLELVRDRVRIVRLNENAGHVEQYLGQFRPQLVGMSICWLLGAIIAYNDKRDFIYKEQDTLCFGPWEEELYKRGQFYQLMVQMGYAACTPARVECCLFWVNHEFIPEFIAKYIAISDGDGKTTPEEKFDYVSKLDRRIVPIPFGVGRDRPLPYADPIWFGQRFTDDEMAELRRRNLV